MAGNLTSEQIAQLIAQYRAGNYGLNESGYAPTAVVHSGEDAGNPSQLLGFGGNFSGLTPGSTYDRYGTNGSYEGQHTTENGGAFKLSDYRDLGQAIAVLGSMYLGGAGLAAAGAGSAAGIGGSGFAAGAGGAAAAEGAGGAALAGDVLSKAALDGTTAFGANSVPGAFDLASMGGASGMTGAGTDIFGGNGMMTGFTDTGTAQGALDTAYAGSGALTGATGLVSPELAGAGGAVGSAAGTAAGTGGLLSSAGSLLGPAATLLGAAAGSKPQQTTQTSTRDIPEALKPYVYGQGGLLPSAQSLFQQQIANPQGWQQMSNVGLGLLNQPIAGNGYAQFAAQPRFGR